jgi:hypothetical protein
MSSITNLSASSPENEPESQRTLNLSKYITTTLVHRAGPEARLRFPAVYAFSLLYRVQADSGSHSASYPIGTMEFFPGVKGAGAF